MKSFLATAIILIVAATCCAQSLGDVARANRAKPKPSSAKTITNEDLPGATKTGPPSDLARELDHIKLVLQEICLDPKTNGGRTLSDYDKQALTGGVKPLRARINDYERIQKEYKQSFAKLDLEMETAMQAAAPKERALNDGDIQKLKGIRSDYEARRAALLQEGEARLSGYRKLQLDLEEIGKECPEAAKTVPD
jgi:hypothetical protein